ncbi:hypothetical protein B0T25DRAFT_337318 [Lasiosphaeria hispida]|uniref:Uncharacterized protein n=1 Tax=Lasiosphaeria hispida TaxID=260671 RepID=A0AAJ0M804_9PEZI|nr:hypothetical protein B0T25DRAFT_337318 [Lasiosphaeria hispida]
MQTDRGGGCLSSISHAACTMSSSCSVSPARPGHFWPFWHSMRLRCCCCCCCCCGVAVLWCGLGLIQEDQLRWLRNGGKPRPAVRSLTAERHGAAAAGRHLYGVSSFFSPWRGHVFQLASPHHLRSFQHGPKTETGPGLRDASNPTQISIAAAVCLSGTRSGGSVAQGKLGIRTKLPFRPLRFGQEISYASRGSVRRAFGVPERKPSNIAVAPYAVALWPISVVWMGSRDGLRPVASEWK